MTRRVQRAAFIVLCGYIVVVGVILLTAESTLATAVIARTEAWLTAHGAPAWATWPGRVELALNAAMFAPLTFLAAVALLRHPWGNWVTYCFVGSGVVEVVQAFALEARSAQYVDVVANTLGGLAGALTAIPLCSWLRSLSDGRSA